MSVVSVKVQHVLLLLAAVGCSQREDVAGASSSTSSASNPPALEAPLAPLGEVPSPGPSLPEAPRAHPPFVMPYPRANWRLANPDALGHVVQWFSQILIRHEGVRNEVPFNLAYWFSAPPRSTRSREDALALAREIAARAAQDPKQFADLARRYSEDITNRDDGGAMGGVVASSLVLWPQILDALAALQPGDVSEVVETRYGFHVLLRSAPPAEVALGGSHIVIAHDQAQWIELEARGPVPRRTRDEALALATDLYRKARAAPQRFAELAKKSSDQRDAVVGGDFGQWSTREGTSYPARMRRLLELRVGEVGAPVETHLGFEIVQRTPPRPRSQYRAQTIELGFDSGAEPGTDLSRDVVQAKAEAIASVLATAPDRFDELARNTSWVRQWEEGRGLPALTSALEALKPGEITKGLIPGGLSFLIARRLPLEPVAAVRFETELPRVEHPDLEAHFDNMDPRDVSSLLSEAIRDARAGARLPLGKVDALTFLVQQLSPDQTPEEQVGAVRTLLTEARAVLGEGDYAAFSADLQRRITTNLFSAEPDSKEERGL